QRGFHRALGLPLPHAAAHGAGHVPRGAGRMKSFATALLAALLAGGALPADAQHDAHAHHAPKPQAGDAHGEHASQAHADPTPTAAGPHDHAGHAWHARPAQPPSPLPSATAAERAAAFPAELEGMDMRGHMDDNPL